MKKTTSMLCALLLCLLLPLSALAEAGYPAECGAEGHHTQDGLDHNRPQSCWVKGHNYCDGMNHDRAACGKWGHYNCDGKTHAASDCGAEGHFACDKLTHGLAACGVEGHCVSDGKRHIAAACGAEGHYVCDGQTHKAAVCGNSAHYACDGGEHERAACGKSGHDACDGLEHAQAACGVYGHCASDGGEHGAAPCGHAGHTLCDGQTHEAAACGVEGHYACEARAHNHKVVSKYCNATPQHVTCQGDVEHYCDPAQGGCGDTYLCSNSNAHTACRMCGLLWCDRALGGHETPCSNAGHRPCVYTMNGKTYVKDEHQQCYWCGEAKCNGDDHGEGICVDTCDACGYGKRFNERHVYECGHYSCVASRIKHERCPLCGEGYTCDPHHSHIGRPNRGHRGQPDHDRHKRH